MRHQKSFFPSALIYGLLSVSGSTVFAQTRGNNTGVDYDYTYFAAFSPQTALDMVDRLPGFSLDPGSDLRGFGAGVGNVLIDGTRPPSKEGGIEEVLQRIPADLVVRIEIIRGRATASETSGHSVVANVILAPNEASLHWALKVQNPSDGRLSFLSDIAMARHLAGWATSTRISASVDRKPLSGSRASRDEMGELIFFQVEDSPSSTSAASISSEAKRNAFGGSIAANGRFSHRLRKVDTVRIGFDGRRPDTSPDQHFSLDLDRTWTDAEFGIDWTRPLVDDWSLKLLSLNAYKDHASDQIAVTERPPAGASISSFFSSDQSDFETIIRSTLAKGGDHKWRPEIGIESTYNRLNSELSLLTRDAGGSSNISLSAANVVVEEFRGEAFASLSYAATDKLTLETGFAAEVSEISVSGDTSNTEQFSFVKPSAFIVYDWLPGIQFRTGVRRTVGQLDFSDFAASASAADDRLTAGNPALRPNQTTRASFSVDLTSNDHGASNIEVFHEWRDDILEEIALPSGEFGIGNAGSARVWGVKADISYRLQPIIPGGLLEIEAVILDSIFDDPISDKSRTTSNTDTPSILAEFRQDLPNQQFSWGLSYRASLEGTYFFANEESFNRDSAAWGAFIETTHIAGAKVTLKLAEIGGQNFLRERTYFSPDRSGDVTGSERISRNQGMTISLNVSRQL